MPGKDFNTNFEHILRTPTTSYAYFGG